MKKAGFRMDAEAGSFALLQGAKKATWAFDMAENFGKPGKITQPGKRRAHRDVEWITEGMHVKKRGRALLLAGLLACMGIPAPAQAAYAMQGTVAPGMPELTFAVTDTGERLAGNAQREKVFAVQIDAQDGSFSQTLTYAACVSPDDAYVAEMVDFNFDGYQDLALCVGLGSNAYSIMALWNVENGCFDAPYQELELCNYRLYPERNAVFSYEKDGAVHYRMTLYSWAGTRASSLTLDAQGGTYYTDDVHTIGERLTFEGTGIWHCWDEQYDQDWYTRERVFAERYEVLRGCILGDLVHGEAQFARVANVDWVNLRKEDSKASPSLARLDAGTMVRVLATDCGEDGGWIRVMTEMEGEDGVFASQTGYIWHSFLENE